LLNKGKSIEAVLILKETVKEFPNFPYAYYLLGIARMKSGLFCLAKRAFEAANKLESNNSENLRNLGWAKIMLGEIEDGRNDLRNAINSNLVDCRAYLDLAMSYFNYLDFDEGFAWMKRAKALDPKNKFIKINYKFAEDAKKDYLKLSEAQRKKIKKEKLLSEMQSGTHLSILRNTFSDRGFNEKEMEELKKELDLSGLSKKMLIYKDDMMKNETEKSIHERQKKIEESLLTLIKELKVSLTVDKIKKIIYREKGHRELNEITKEFDRGQNLEEFNKILQLLNDAWNYFPHKSLNGLSPAEKILEYQEKENKN